MAPQLMEKHAWRDLEEVPENVRSERARWGRIVVPEVSEPRPSQLARLVELDIVPRLVRSQRAALELPLVVMPSGEIIDEFSRLVLLDDAEALSKRVKEMQANGESLEVLYLGLLTGTARRLGELWEDDRLDFTRVTLGLYRLQQVLRNFSPAFQVESTRHEPDRRALLLSTPGEQHSFGLSMLGEFLFRAGWAISSGPGMSLHELGEVVNGEWFSMVGLSLSCEARLAALVSSIKLIRRASRNRSVGIMVGGPFFVAHPELMKLVGADATAPDARQAVIEADNLANPRRKRC